MIPKLHSSQRSKIFKDGIETILGHISRFRVDSNLQEVIFYNLHSSPFQGTQLGRTILEIIINHKVYFFLQLEVKCLLFQFFQILPLKGLTVQQIVRQAFARLLASLPEVSFFNAKVNILELNLWLRKYSCDYYGINEDNYEKSVCNILLNIKEISFEIPIQHLNHLFPKKAMQRLIEGKLSECALFEILNPLLFKLDAIIFAMSDMMKLPTSSRLMNTLCLKKLVNSQFTDVTNFSPNKAFFLNRTLQLVIVFDLCSSKNFVVYSSKSGNLCSQYLSSLRHLLSIFCYMCEILKQNYNFEVQVNTSIFVSVPPGVVISSDILVGFYLLNFATLETLIEKVDKNMRKVYLQMLYFHKAMDKMEGAANIHDKGLLLLQKVQNILDLIPQDLAKLFMISDDTFLLCNYLSYLSDLRLSYFLIVVSALSEEKFLRVLPGTPLLKDLQNFESHFLEHVVFYICEDFEFALKGDDIIRILFFSVFSAKDTTAYMPQPHYTQYKTINLSLINALSHMLKMNFELESIEVAKENTDEDVKGCLTKKISLLFRKYFSFYSVLSFTLCFEMRFEDFIHSLLSPIVISVDVCLYLNTNNITSSCVNQYALDLKAFIDQMFLMLSILYHSEKINMNKEMADFVISQHCPLFYLSKSLNELSLYCKSDSDDFSTSHLLWKPIAILSSQLRDYFLGPFYHNLSLPCQERQRSFSEYSQKLFSMISPVRNGFTFISNFLKNWASFILIEDFLYVKQYSFSCPSLLKRDEEKEAFCLLKITYQKDATFIGMQIFFLHITPIAHCRLICDELKNNLLKIEMTKIELDSPSPNCRDSKSSATFFETNVFNKHVKQPLIMHEKNDRTKYLYAERFIWKFSSETCKFKLEAQSLQMLANLLSIVRQSQGFNSLHLCLSDRQHINMAKEVAVTQNNCTKFCLVQYIVLLSFEENIEIVNSLENTNCSIIVEVFVDVVEGKISKDEGLEFLHDLECLEIPSAIFKEDNSLISLLSSFKSFTKIAAISEKALSSLNLPLDKSIFDSRFICNTIDSNLQMLTHFVPFSLNIFTLLFHFTFDSLSTPIFCFNDLASEKSDILSCNRLFFEALNSKIQECCNKISLNFTSEHNKSLLVEVLRREFSDIESSNISQFMKDQCREEEVPSWSFFINCDKTNSFLCFCFSPASFSDFLKLYKIKNKIKLLDSNHKKCIKKKAPCQYIELSFCLFYTSLESLIYTQHIFKYEKMSYDSLSKFIESIKHKVNHILYDSYYNTLFKAINQSLPIDSKDIDYILENCGMENLVPIDFTYFALNICCKLKKHDSFKFSYVMNNFSCKLNHIISMYFIKTSKLSKYLAFSVDRNNEVCTFLNFSEKINYANANNEDTFEFERNDANPIKQTSQLDALKLRENNEFMDTASSFNFNCQSTSFSIRSNAGSFSSSSILSVFYNPFDSLDYFNNTFSQSPDSNLQPLFLHSHFTIFTQSFVQSFDIIDFSRILETFTLLIDSSEESNIKKVIIELIFLSVMPFLPEKAPNPCKSFVDFPITSFQKECIESLVSDINWLVEDFTVSYLRDVIKYEHPIYLSMDNCNEFQIIGIKESYLSRVCKHIKNSFGHANSIYKEIPVHFVLDESEAAKILPSFLLQMLQFGTCEKYKLLQFDKSNYFVLLSVKSSTNRLYKSENSLSLSGKKEFKKVKSFSSLEKTSLSLQSSSDENNKSPRYSIPEFWLIIQLDVRFLGVHFQTKSIDEENCKKLEELQGVYKSAILRIKETLVKVNQSSLLKDLFKNKKAHDLLIPADNIDPFLHLNPHSIEEDFNTDLNHCEFLAASVQYPPGRFHCKCVWEKKIHLNSRLSLYTESSLLTQHSNHHKKDILIQSLHTSVLNKFSIENRPFTYVFKSKSGGIFYFRVKLSDMSLPLDEGKGKPQPSMFRASHVRSSSNSTIKVSSHSSFLSSSSTSLILGQRQCLHLCFYGISTPTREITQGLVEVITNRLKELLIELLSHSLLRNPSLKLTHEDVDFLQPRSSTPSFTSYVPLPLSIFRCLSIFISFLKETLRVTMLQPKFIEGEELCFKANVNCDEELEPIFQETYLHNMFSYCRSSGLVLVCIELFKLEILETDCIDFRDVCSSLSTLAYVFEKQVEETEEMSFFLKIDLWENCKGSTSYLKDIILQCVMDAVRDVLLEICFLNSPLQFTPFNRIHALNSTRNVFKEEMGSNSTLEYFERLLYLLNNSNSKTNSLFSLECCASRFSDISEIVFKIKTYCVKKTQLIGDIHLLKKCQLEIIKDFNRSVFTDSYKNFSLFNPDFRQNLYLFFYNVECASDCCEDTPSTRKRFLFVHVENTKFTFYAYNFNKEAWNDLRVFCKATFHYFDQLKEKEALIILSNISVSNSRTNCLLKDPTLILGDQGDLKKGKVDQPFYIQRFVQFFESKSLTSGVVEFEMSNTEFLSFLRLFHLIHFCFSPVLIEASWRNQAGKTRGFNKQLDKDHVQTNFSKNTFVEIYSDFKQNYITYLKNLRFTSLTILSTPHPYNSHDKTASDALSNEDVNENVYMFKRVSGGILLLALAFAKPFYSIKFYICDYLHFSSYETRFQEQNHNESFDRSECEKVITLSHFHSFMYDHHIRILNAYANYGSFLFTLDFPSVLNDFSKYYIKSPGYANNFLFQKNLILDNVDVFEFFSFLLQNPYLIGFRAFTGSKANLSSNFLKKIFTKNFSQSNDHLPSNFFFDVSVIICLGKCSTSPSNFLDGYYLNVYITFCLKVTLFPKMSLETKLGSFKTVTKCKRPFSNEAKDGKVEGSFADSNNALKNWHLQSFIELENINYLSYYTFNEDAMIKLFSDEGSRIANEIKNELNAVIIIFNRETTWNKFFEVLKCKHRTEKSSKLASIFESMLSSASLILPLSSLNPSLKVFSMNISWTKHMLQVHKSKFVVIESDKNAMSYAIYLCSCNCDPYSHILYVNLATRVLWVATKDKTKIQSSDLDVVACIQNFIKLCLDHI